MEELFLGTVFFCKELNIIDKQRVEGVATIEADMFPSEIINSYEGAEHNVTSLMGAPLREAREAFEREYLRVQIKRFSGNISKTAAFVGMERSALHRKLKSLGVVSPNKGAGEDEDFDAEEEA